MTLVKLTAPGVPDLYQGTELWDLSLVDPDNRRPVDYDLRRRLLAEVDGLTPRRAVGPGRRGPAQARTSPAPPCGCAASVPRPSGPARPVPSGGSPAQRRRPSHVVAFARGDRVATVVPRLVLGLDRRGGCGDTTVDLPRGRLARTC